MAASRPYTRPLVAAPLVCPCARPLESAPLVCPCARPLESAPLVFLCARPLGTVMYVLGRCGLQRLELCGGGFISPACWLDAGSSLAMPTAGSARLCASGSAALRLCTSTPGDQLPSRPRRRSQPCPPRLCVSTLEGSTFTTACRGAGSSAGQGDGRSGRSASGSDEVCLSSVLV